MPAGPTIKRAFAFFDGQNLFYAAKEAFGYSYPNYDPKLLAERICASKSWTVASIHFYTGVPSPGDKPDWNYFWTAKMRPMAIQASATSKLNLGLRVFFSEFVRVSLRHPSQALFFARTIFWQAGAARRRARGAAEGITVPPIAILSITNRCS